MSKRFTPVIGLAVVVALALAMVAVFGAMSLTNPAWAQTPEVVHDDLMIVRLCNLYSMVGFQIKVWPWANTETYNLNCLFC